MTKRNWIIYLAHKGGATVEMLAEFFEMTEDEINVVIDDIEYRHEDIYWEDEND